MNSIIKGLIGAALACASLAGLPAQAQTRHTVGATATGVPFTFLDVKTNTIQGMMVDTVTAVGRAAGFEVDIQQTVFSSLIPSLTSGKIDIISAAMLKTQQRAEVVDFTDPVFAYGEGLVVKADDKGRYIGMDALKDEVVGAQVGTAFLDALNRKGIFKEVRSYDSIADILRDVGLGRIKAGFGDRPILAYQLSQNPNPAIRLVGEYQPAVMGQVSLVVRKGDTALRDRLNQGIAKIRADGTLVEIIRKWNLN